MAMAAPQQLNVAQRIRWARKRAGISQETLAAKTGITRRHIIRLENGTHAPNAETRAKIAEATGQDPSLFADGDDDEEDAAMAADLVRALKALIRSEREAVA